MPSPPWCAGLTPLGVAAGVPPAVSPVGVEMLAMGWGLRLLGAAGKGQKDLKLSPGASSA